MLLDTGLGLVGIVGGETGGDELLKLAELSLSPLGDLPFKFALF